MLKPRHQKFAEGIASGMSGTAAYLAAYPDATSKSARTNAAKLLANAGIAAEIKRLQSDSREKSVLTLADKLTYLAEVVLTPADKVAPGSRICQGIKPGKFGNTVLVPCKLRALELHAKLAGELREQVTHEAGDSLLEFFMDIRRNGQADDKNAIAGNVER